jgi:electron transport complex protein RnfB
LINGFSGWKMRLNLLSKSGLTLIASIEKIIFLSKGRECGHIYKELANHLDRLPVPFPATESGAELRLLEHWFTLEEARIALKMNGIPEPASKIAKRLDMSEEKLAPVLMDMSKKGLLFRVSKNEHLYAIVPLAEGIWEFHVNSLTEKDLEYMHAYLDEFMEKGWYSTKTTQHRIIPISKSISTDTEIYSYDQAEAIIKAQTTISVADCICRKEHEMIGKGCIPKKCAWPSTQALITI